MTIRHQIEIDSVALLAFAASVGVLLALFGNHSPKIGKTTLNLPVMQFAPVTPTPVVSPTPTPQQPTTVSQTSPDGTKTLFMTMTPGTKNTSFLFAVSSDKGTTRQTIYSTTLPNTENMSIPFNTFSPDSKYFFIEQLSSSDSSALVFRTDGSPLTNTAQYVNETEIFKTKEPQSTYDKTTGWASETLLIIVTKNADKTEGTSYWFEVPSTAVIPLATQF